MRIPSGKTDQLIFFVAVDSTDLKTRKTGLTSFTVYRSRNGGTATVYTTPTVAELDATHMPGVYSLTVDEDTTIASTSDSEEYCVHITQASMAPVTRTVELYRRDVTTGNQLLVDASGRVDVIKLAGTTCTARDIGASVLLSAGTGTGQLDFTSGVVKANLAQILGTALTETSGQIAAAFKQFFNIASPTSTMNTITAVTTATTATNLTNAPTSGDFTAAMKTSLNAATPAVTVSDKTGFSLSSAGVQAIWDKLTSALTTVGSIGKLLVDNVDAAISSRGTSTLTQTQVTGGAYSVQSSSCVLGDARIAHLDADVSSRLASASYTAPDNTSITGIKTQTDKLAFSVTNQVDCNAKSMNGSAINGTGTSGDLWRGA